MKTFRALTPPLLAPQKYRNVDDHVDLLVGTLNLRTLLRDLTRAYKKRQLKTFRNNAPAELACLLPSILTRHTSEALLQMSRTQRDQRLESPLFRLALCRKLRLPILPTSDRKCKCDRTIDVFGDHFFTCKHHSKTAIHNRVRDAVFLTLTEIGAHAGIITSPSDVTLEPTNLAQANPTSRPADVCVDLRHTYAAPPLIPFTKAAIDVSITPPLPPPSGGDSSYTVSVTSHHQSVERKKFRGPSVGRSHVNGEEVIRALNDSNVVLIPFTVDPHGGLGPFANRLYFGLRPRPAPPPLRFESQTSQIAYNNARSASSPIALLPKADASWLHSSSHIPFGPTYHSWHASTWSRQILGANINYAFASHLYKGIHASYERRPRTPRTQLYPLAIGRLSRRYPVARPTDTATGSLQHSTLPPAGMG